MGSIVVPQHCLAGSRLARYHLALLKDSQPFHSFRTTVRPELTCFAEEVYIRVGKVYSTAQDQFVVVSVLNVPRAYGQAETISHAAPTFRFLPGFI